MVKVSVPVWKKSTDLCDAFSECMVLYDFRQFWGVARSCVGGVGVSLFEAESEQTRMETFKDNAQAGDSCG